MSRRKPALTLVVSCHLFNKQIVIDYCEPNVMLVVVSNLEMFLLTCQRVKVWTVKRVMLYCGSWLIHVQKGWKLSRIGSEWEEDFQLASYSNVTNTIQTIHGVVESRTNLRSLGRLVIALYFDASKLFVSGETMFARYFSPVLKYVMRVKLVVTNFDN